MEKIRFFAIAILVFAGVGSSSSALAKNLGPGEEAFTQLVKRIYADIPADASGNPGQRPQGAAPAAIAPKQIEISTYPNGLRGAFTELFPNSGVFVASRHVLQGIKNEYSIESAFSESGLKIAGYSFFGFYENGTKNNDSLDLIIAIPRVDVSKYLSQKKEPCQCDQQGSVYQFRMNRNIQGFVDIGDLFYTYGYGTIGNDAIQQLTSGKVSQVGGGNFYLPSNPDSSISPRSSGSVVMTIKDDQTRWRPAGIIQCVVRPKQSKQGVPIPGAVRVIPFVHLLDLDAREISINDITREKYSNLDPDCIFVGGGDGGN